MWSPKKRKKWVAASGPTFHPRGAHPRAHAQKHNIADLGGWGKRGVKTGVRGREQHFGVPKPEVKTPKTPGNTLWREFVDPENLGKNLGKPGKHALATHFGPPKPPKIPGNNSGIAF